MKTYNEKEIAKIIKDDLVRMDNILLMEEICVDMDISKQLVEIYCHFFDNYETGIYHNLLIGESEAVYGNKLDLIYAKFNRMSPEFKILLSKREILSNIRFAIPCADNSQAHGEIVRMSDQ